MIVDLPTTSPLTRPRTDRAQDTRGCTTCGYQNPPQAGSCLNCNAPLGENCPVCKQEVPPGGKFCGQCGSPVQGPAPGARSGLVPQRRRALLAGGLARKLPASGGEIFGEYREVTVLFVNLVNGAADLYEPDEEDLYFARGDVLQVLSKVVEKYEGTVDKFTQDGLVALFGAPNSHENDPERAVRTALEMRQVLQPWLRQTYEETGLQFSLRFGLNSGPVIAGKLGNKLHMDYTVIGDTVKLAAHLESLAEPGAIVIGEKTYRRVHSIFDCQPLPAVNTDKGRIRPYRVVGKLNTAKRGRPVSMFQQAMIGRAHELSQLQETVRDVCQNGHSRVALITGEAGLGKTRLVTEFCRTLSQQTVEIYEGSCLTYTRAIPLGVVADLLRNILKITESTPARAQHEALHAYAQALDLANNDILPYLTLVLGLRQTDQTIEHHLRLMDAAMLQRQTHAALRQVLLAEAKKQPTLLIFEDLHWIDPASREFIEYLIHTSSEAPLFIVMVSRAAERATVIHKFVRLAEQAPERWLDLRIGPLSATDAQGLVDQLIAQSGPEAGALKQQITRRAEGNPLFVEEIVRMLIDQGGLERDLGTGAWQVTSQANGLLNTVPGTVKGLILARFDRLPEGMRRTLQKAAVFGTSFPTALIQAINSPAPEATAAQLEELAARQFLIAKPYRSNPGYAFQHTLLQETIYHALIRQDRSKVHTQIAQTIECSTLWLPEEQAEVLAHHYGESTFPSKAVPYLNIAGHNAARRCAYETAIKHFRRAIQILPAQPAGSNEDAFFQTRLGLGNALKFVGELAEAGEMISEVLQKLWHATLALYPDPLQSILVESLRQLADIRQREGSYEAALQYLKVGLDLLGDSGDQTDLAAQRPLLERIAWIHFRKGQLDEALSIAVTATENLSLETADDPITLASLYNTLGGIAWQQDKLEEAADYVQRSLNLHDHVGYLWGVATAYGNLGILYYQQGQWAKAINYYEQAYAVHHVIGNREGQAVSFDNLGLLYLAMGDYESARQDLKAALAIRQQLGDTWGTAQTEVNMAQLALAIADVAEANGHAELALSLARAIGSTDIQVEGLWVQALVYAETGRLADGLQVAQQALAIARQAGLNQKEPECLRVLGSLQRRSGQYDQAEPLLQEALKLSEARNDPYQQGQTWLELGQMYQAREQVQATTAFANAVDLFDRLGADRRLQQAHAALAQ